MLTFSSPAKINLFLRVLHHRCDGFHELASLFQAVNLCDTLTFEKADADSLTCSDPTLPTDNSNLVNKAVRLFQVQTGIDTHFAIHLQKNIPQQAGLGGGSSNAATTLWGLNELCGRPANPEQLSSWGAVLGSDVAFFLSTGTAYCTGRGEIIQSLAPLPQTKLSIVKPQQGLSTPQVYGSLKADTLPKRDPEAALKQFLTGQPQYFNDLEVPAFQVMPSLAALKEQLQKSGFSTVLMSGSGTSFFCVGEGKVPSSLDLQQFQVQFINRQPEQWYST